MVVGTESAGMFLHRISMVLILDNNSEIGKLEQSILFDLLMAFD